MDLFSYLKGIIDKMIVLSAYNMLYPVKISAFSMRQCRWLT